MPVRWSSLGVSEFEPTPIYCPGTEIGKAARNNSRNGVPNYVITPASLSEEDLTFTSEIRNEEDIMSQDALLKREVDIYIGGKHFKHNKGSPVKVMVGNNKALLMLDCNTAKKSWWGGRKTRKARHMRKKRRSTRGRSH